jgi:hypothetical protein
MGNGLENRLRKIEKTVGAQEDEINSGAWRETAEKLRSTPEARSAVRAYCERRFRATWAEERKRIEAVTRPEGLVFLRRKWAKEDADSKAREDEYTKAAVGVSEEIASMLREGDGKPWVLWKD